MIVINTNVLSELMRSTPDPAVVSWVGTVMPGEATTTAVTVAEIGHGIARLSKGKRRDRLAEVFASLVDEIAHEILPFDLAAAECFPAIARAREQSGRPIDELDGMIAAICVSRGAALATRNTRDFEDTGIDLVNPWVA